MTFPYLRAATLVALVAFAPSAWSQSKCMAKGVMGGQPFDLAYCEVAYYMNGHGVTVWFSSTPITADEREFFQRSSSADRFASGRTMVHVGFCPGGAGATPSPAAATRVEIGFTHATVASLGPQSQFLFDPPKDKDIRIDRLAGELKPGGKLTGRISGAKATRATTFKWELDFDLTLPPKSAGAGPGCGP